MCASEPEEKGKKEKKRHRGHHSFRWWVTTACIAIVQALGQRTAKDTPAAPPPQIAVTPAKGNTKAKHPRSRTPKRAPAEEPLLCPCWIPTFTRYDSIDGPFLVEDFVLGTCYCDDVY